MVARCDQHSNNDIDHWSCYHALALTCPTGAPVRNFSLPVVRGPDVKGIYFIFMTLINEVRALKLCRLDVH